jgi:hypothetical protein
MSREAVKQWTAACVSCQRQGVDSIARTVLGLGAYATTWGIIFGLLTLLVMPANIKVDSQWLLGAVFVVTYILYVYVLPRRIL